MSRGSSLMRFAIRDSNSSADEIDAPAVRAAPRGESGMVSDVFSFAPIGTPACGAALATAPSMFGFEEPTAALRFATAGDDVTDFGEDEASITGFTVLVGDCSGCCVDEDAPRVCGSVPSHCTADAFGSAAAPA